MSKLFWQRNFRGMGFSEFLHSDVIFPQLLSFSVCLYRHLLASFSRDILLYLFFSDGMSFFKLPHDYSTPNVHVTYTSVPVPNSTVILGTDIYTYQPTSSSMASYTESALPRKTISSTDSKDTAGQIAEQQMPSSGGASNPWGNVKPTLGVVIAHPYPPLGGSKADGVVRYLANRFISALGSAVVVYAFNFRGVTTRTSWTSKTEQQDMLSVADAMITAYSSSIRTVLLVGYSYGALIASKVAVDSSEMLGQEVDVALWLISPPLWPACGVLTLSLRARDSEPQFYKFVGKVKLRQVATLPAAAANASPDGRVLVVYGTSDSFTRTGRFQKWIKVQYTRISEEFPGFDANASTSGNDSMVSVVEVDGGSHFWKQEDLDMIWDNDTVQRFLSKVSGTTLATSSEETGSGAGSGASSVVDSDRLIGNNKWED
ncbi:Alpha/Beta hydrolase protein [Kockiozyma suomiensis]|uniref:Alpha/Beta hydrolase protein n=1 Tax=Kockiozyma suomiensis TaxID=1337062 RepID=UPI0033440DDB